MMSGRKDHIYAPGQTQTECVLRSVTSARIPNHPEHYVTGTVLYVIL